MSTRENIRLIARAPLIQNEVDILHAFRKNRFK